MMARDHHHLSKTQNECNKPMTESEESEFILIVDEVTNNFSVLSKLLKSAGFKFRVAIDRAS